MQIDTKFTPYILNIDYLDYLIEEFYQRSNKNCVVKRFIPHALKIYFN